MGAASGNTGSASSIYGQHVEAGAAGGHDRSWKQCFQPGGMPGGLTSDASSVNGTLHDPQPQSCADQVDRKTHILKQQRMLLFLCHCAKCTDAPCQYGGNCTVGKDLWAHIMKCGDPKCQHPLCVRSRNLLRHYHQCPVTSCPVCGPVNEFVKHSQPPHGGGDGAPGGIGPEEKDTVQNLF